MVPSFGFSNLGVEPTHMHVDGAVARDTSDKLFQCSPPSGITFGDVKPVLPWGGGQRLERYGWRYVKT